MGTRADFYVGKGKDAEWIGSIAWDGYPEGIDKLVRSATTSEDFRNAVEGFFRGRDDVTLPSQGWPWPWDDSGTTDYSYWHYDEKTWGSCFGHSIFDASKDHPEDDDGEHDGDIEFEMPDMGSRKNVTLGSRSGLIVVSC